MTRGSPSSDFELRKDPGILMIKISGKDATSESRHPIGIVAFEYSYPNAGRMLVLVVASS